MLITMLKTYIINGMVSASMGWQFPINSSSHFASYLIWWSVPSNMTSSDVLVSSSLFFSLGLNLLLNYNKSNKILERTSKAVKDTEETARSGDRISCFRSSTSWVLPGALVITIFEKAEALKSSGLSTSRQGDWTLKEAELSPGTMRILLDSSARLSWGERCSLPHLIRELW